MVIENGAFDQLSSLEFLDINSNRLFTLSAQLFSPIISFRKLKMLDIHGRWLFVVHFKRGSMNNVHLENQFDFFQFKIENFSIYKSISRTSMTAEHHLQVLLEERVTKATT